MEPLFAQTCSDGEDARLRRDTERLAQRICLRVEGCCVIGFAGAAPREEEATV